MPQRIDVTLSMTSPYDSARNFCAQEAEPRFMSHPGFIQYFDNVSDSFHTVSTMREERSLVARTSHSRYPLEYDAYSFPNCNYYFKGNTHTQDVPCRVDPAAVESGRSFCNEFDQLLSADHVESPNSWISNIGTLNSPLDSPGYTDELHQKVSNYWPEQNADLPSVCRQGRAGMDNNYSDTLYDRSRETVKSCRTFSPSAIIGTNLNPNTEGADRYLTDTCERMSLRVHPAGECYYSSVLPGNSEETPWITSKNGALSAVSQEYQRLQQGQRDQNTCDCSIGQIKQLGRTEIDTINCEAEFREKYYFKDQKYCVNQSNQWLSSNFIQGVQGQINQRYQWSDCLQQIQQPHQQQLQPPSHHEEQQQQQCHQLPMQQNEQQRQLHQTASQLLPPLEQLVEQHEQLPLSGSTVVMTTEQTIIHRSNPHQQQPTATLSEHGSVHSGSYISPIHTQDMSSCKQVEHMEEAGQVVREREERKKSQARREERVAENCRGRRFEYTEQQRDLLENIFPVLQYPTYGQKGVLAKRLGISVGQVKIWFQNRRRKDIIARDRDRDKEEDKEKDKASAYCVKSIEINDELSGLETGSGDSGLPSAPVVTQTSKLQDTRRGYPCQQIDVDHDSERSSVSRFIPTDSTCRAKHQTTIKPFSVIQAEDKSRRATEAEQELNRVKAVASSSNIVGAVLRELLLVQQQENFAKLKRKSSDSVEQSNEKRLRLSADDKPFCQTMGSNPMDCLPYKGLAGIELPPDLIAALLKPRQPDMLPRSGLCGAAGEAGKFGLSDSQLADSVVCAISKSRESWPQPIDTRILDMEGPPNAVAPSYYCIAH